MNTDFTTLIGQFIHHCGAIELLINNSIRAFSTDNIHSSNAVKLPLYKRINLLQKILSERSELKGETIDNLCKDLHHLRKQRNIVAHNPILINTSSKSPKEEIHILRYGSESVTYSNELDKKDLTNLVINSNKILNKFSDLIPASKAT